MIQKLSGRARGLYNDYPKPFWVLVSSMFIDQMGRTILNPFLVLYVTKRFGVGMTEVGLLFGMISVAGTFGRMVGGALTDRLGRKSMVLLGLFISGMSSLAIGMAGSFELLFAIMLFVGLVASFSGPAYGAMVADILPEEKRTGGFAIFRMMVNLCWICGPTLGGLLASRSYMPLFILDAVASTIAAIIVFLAIPETKPAPQEGKQEESMRQTFIGYRDVLQDTTFVLFIGACILIMMAYTQVYTTLAVYLRDVQGMAEISYGYLMSMNATIVVLVQLPLSRWTEKYPSTLRMAAGALLYAIGLAMYGPFTTALPFIIAMLLITFGEMLELPTRQAVVAQLAPRDMRGRYMAMAGFGWAIPNAIAPLLAGLIMDNGDPRWVWYASGLVGLAAACSFVMLQQRVRRTAKQRASEVPVAVPAQ